MDKKDVVSVGGGACGIISLVIALVNGLDSSALKPSKILPFLLYFMVLDRPSINSLGINGFRFSGAIKTGKVAIPSFWEL